MQPTITMDTFLASELRVGRVIEATLPEWSRKLIELKVDFGSEIGQRTILTGVREWYQAADFQDQTYIFIVNLAERKMGEGVSQGMILMADGDDKPVPLTVVQPVPVGTLVR